MCKLCLTTLTSQTEIKNIRKLEFSWITKGTGPAPLVNRHSSQKGDYVAGILDSDTAYLIYSVNRIRSVNTWVELPCALQKIKFLAFLSVLCSQTSVCLEREIFFSWTRNLCDQPSVKDKYISVRWVIVYFSSYFLECEETEVSLRDALKDKEPTYDSLIESKKRRIAFIFSFDSSIHQLEVFVIGKF